MLRSHKIPVDADKPTSVMLFREELASHLIAEAQRLHPKAISFTFLADIQDVSLEAQTITVTTAGGSAQVGCCGWRTVVHQQLLHTAQQAN